MRRLLGVTVLLGALLMGSSCGGDGGSTGTGPGTLKVRLTAPPANADTAIIITITGPVAPTSATAAIGLRLFQSSAGTTTRYALVGPLANGATILTIGVPDVAAFSQYHGTVDGVAQANYQLRALNGYALALTR
jgi:hypothetical protein